MSAIFRKKTPFEKYYRQLIHQDIVQQCKIYKPLSAAYLYIIYDYLFKLSEDTVGRMKSAREIFSLLEKKYLTVKELEYFDLAIDLFGEILNRNITPRGDWCYNDGSECSPLFSVHLCYGDLIFAPEYINDYQNAPIVVKSMEDTLLFMRQFHEVQHLTEKYMEAFVTY